MILTAQVEAAEQFEDVGHIRVFFLFGLQLRHVRFKVRLEPLVHTAEGETGVGAFHVHTDPVDPDRVDGFVHVAGGEFRRMSYGVGDDLEFGLPFRVGLRVCFLLRLFSEMARVGDHAFVAVDHGFEGQFLLFVRVFVRFELRFDFVDDAGQAETKDFRIVEDGMGQSDRLPHEDGGPALIQLLADGFVIFLADIFAEIAMGPVREDFGIELFDLFRRQFPVGVQHTLVDGHEFRPDHGALRIGVQRHTDLFGGRGTGEQVALADDGLALLHQVFEGQALALDRDPGSTVGLRLEAGLAEILRQDLGTFRAEFRSPTVVDVQIFL